MEAHDGGQEADPPWVWACADEEEALGVLATLRARGLDAQLAPEDQPLAVRVARDDVEIARELWTRAHHTWAVKVDREQVSALLRRRRLGAWVFGGTLGVVLFLLWLVWP